MVKSGEEDRSAISRTCRRASFAYSGLGKACPNQVAVLIIGIYWLKARGKRG